MRSPDARPKRIRMPAVVRSLWVSSRREASHRNRARPRGGRLRWMALGLSVLGVQSVGLGLSPQAASRASTPVRTMGSVTEITAGSMTLRTDAGPNMVVLLSEGVTVLRVPPGATDLKAATKIAPGDIAVGDRVLARGRHSDDQNSIIASSLIVMGGADLTKARETERREWREHGIAGLVKAVDRATEEITISVPNLSTIPGYQSHPVTIKVAAKTMLLRYAPDTVKFSDAKPGTFDQIKLGDQVRALGSKSEDGTEFAAEKLVSGTFRNIGATAVSVDLQAGTITLKDLATGQQVLVRTNADTRMHRLPPSMAQRLAKLNAPGALSKAGSVSSESGSPSGAPGAAGEAKGDGAGGDIQQMLEHTPPLTLSELKPSEPLIVVSTEGSKPSEVTAIMVLAGVEPILAAQPKGSKEMVLKQWSLGMGGAGESGEGP